MGVTLPLLQLRVLGPGFLQNGDVGIGVFPESEEVLIGSLGFRGVAGEDISAGKAEMRQRAQRKVDDNAAVPQNLLELGACGRSTMGHKDTSPPPPPT